MGILEIALAVAAWRKGWGARALLPLLFGFGIAFFFGLVVGSSGGTADGARGFGLVCDLGVVIALAVMARRAPAASRTSTSELGQAANSAELQPTLDV
jgi:hypothetical protein